MSVKAYDSSNSSESEEEFGLLSYMFESKRSQVEVENLVKGLIFKQEKYIPLKQIQVGNNDWFICSKACQITMTVMESLCHRERK